MKTKKAAPTYSEKTMPYINLKSPEIKEQIDKMANILKKVQLPLPKKGVS